MKSQLTKGHFDTLLKSHFLNKYQASFLDRTFVPSFQKVAGLGPGDTIEYKLQGAVFADMYDLLNKFRRKYDCDYQTEKGSIFFFPAFSDIENTYWEKILE